ncbi:EFR1 family ferrodoxin [Zongyangia hominis]|uniref:Ferredoxin n=1 Tax=Zongyangia hominis TaxID=2763677 RepID=A0A926IBZ1_9FIRM|nr:EFR1 family ferrodoxin [Zongyangia hominis]MBC8570570.1 flavodoxin [Zongyangia hominis]
MILYFSGTGNSEYAAKRIGKAIDDEVVNLFERIQSSDFAKMYSQRPWVVVVPTYAWRIPRIVQKWLEQTPLFGNSEIYFVMTCGGSIGNAGKYLQKLCAKKKMTYRGCMGILMPENYIALFSTPAEEQARPILDQAKDVIDRTARFLQNGESFPKADISFGDKMNSGIVNDLFYPMFVHAKKFYATDGCVSCGKCVSVCPLKNVRLENGKPVWGKDCTHCMACISRCPKEAIEYGNHSKGLPRYTCPENP